jgi:hypothetical protein
LHMPTSPASLARRNDLRKRRHHPIDDPHGAMRDGLWVGKALCATNGGGLSRDLPMSLLSVDLGVVWSGVCTA